LPRSLHWMKLLHFLQLTIGVSLEERRHRAQFMINTSLDEQRKKAVPRTVRN
jgi:hypothetical protein